MQTGFKNIAFSIQIMSKLRLMDIVRPDKKLLL